MQVAFCLACSTVRIRLCGEMDITTVFGTVVPGSSPGGGTQYFFTSPQASTQLHARRLLLCVPEYESMRRRRIWFSGKTRPCQGRVGSSILPIRTKTTPTTLIESGRCRFAKLWIRLWVLGIKDI